jgi:hypothetical protein
MRVNYGVAAAAAALLLSTGGLAVAQQSAPKSAPSATMPGASSMSTQTLHEIKDNNATAAGLNINRKDLSSMSIYGSDGKKIAGVDKVLGDNSNQIKAVTADVGGFLGVGSKEVVIPVDKLQKGKEKNQLQTSLTKDQIQKLDQYAASENSRSGSVGGSAPSSSPGAGTAPRRPSGNP